MFTSLAGVMEVQAAVADRNRATVQNKDKDLLSLVRPIVQVGSSGQGQCQHTEAIKRQLTHIVEIVVWKDPDQEETRYKLHQLRWWDLWERFATSANGLDLNTFVEHLTAMVKRENSNSAIGRTCVARWDQSWAVPDTLYAILAALGTEVEWFASR